MLAPTTAIDTTTKLMALDDGRGIREQINLHVLPIEGFAMKYVTAVYVRINSARDLLPTVMCPSGSMMGVRITAFSTF